MDRQVLHLMETRQLLTLHLVTSLDVSLNLEVAESCSALKEGAEDHVISIEVKVRNERIEALSRQLKIVYQLKAGIVDANNVSPCLQEVIALISGHIDDLLGAV